MAGRSRADKVRGAAATLTTTHQARFEATFAGGTRWDLRWTDGPTRDAVHQMLSTMDIGGADINSYRHFSTRAVALAIIRAAAAGENTRAIRLGSWSSGGLNWTLEDAQYPDRSIDAREEHMVVNLLAAATPPGHRHPDENQILRLVTDRGMAWLLDDGASAANPSLSVVSPIEILTARYAHAEAKWQWERQAKTMNAQAAIAAALADPAIDQAGALALLALLAQQRVQACRDEAAAIAAAVTAGVSWQQIAHAVGVANEEQAKSWVPPETARN